MSLFERVYFIDETIRAKGGVSVEEIAKRFEISFRQAKRDIEYMRNRLNAPILYSKRYRYYHYEKPFNDFEFLNEKSLLTFVFFKNIVKTSKYLPCFSEKIKNMILENLPSKWKSIADNFILYENIEYEEIDFQYLKVLIESQLENKVIKIKYVDVKNKKTERFVVAKKLINYIGKWYLIAFDIANKDLRTFLIARISDMDLSEKPSNEYDAISTYELDAFIKNSFGIFKGKNIQIAKIHFYKTAANIVSKQIWHNDQKITQMFDENKGNYIELQLPFATPDELIGKVLRYGDEAEIIYPTSIRSLWLEKIKKMYDSFIDKSK